MANVYAFARPGRAPPPAKIKYLGAGARPKSCASEHESVASADLSLVHRGTDPVAHSRIASIGQGPIIRRHTYEHHHLARGRWSDRMGGECSHANASGHFDALRHPQWRSACTNPNLPTRPRRGWCAPAIVLMTTPRSLRSRAGVRRPAGRGNLITTKVETATRRVTSRRPIGCVGR